MEPESRPFALDVRPQLGPEQMRAAVASFAPGAIWDRAREPAKNELVIDVAPLWDGAAVFAGGEGHWWRHRYVLVRDVGTGVGVLAVVMLNPSKAGADPEQDDPTIRVWRGYMGRLNVRRLIVVNLYALIATDPAELRATAARDRAEAIGPLNDLFLGAAVASADQTIVAWGAHATGRLGARVADVVQLVRDRARGPLMCLGTTTGGAPVHPLRKTVDRTPAPWTPPEPRA